MGYYNLYVLITGMNNTVNTRTVFKIMALISEVFLYQVFL